jgi:transcriptional regulator with XRE-family HTH domain
VAESLSHRKALAQAIRHYRKQAKMTQEQLAEAADLNPKYIGEVERRRQNISIDALVRIAKALKVRFQDLVRDF